MLGLRLCRIGAIAATMLLCIVAAHAQDSEYVRNTDLEPGYGLTWWEDVSNQTIPFPNVRIYNLSVSPNGRWLAYKEEGAAFKDYLKVKDLQTGTTRILGDGLWGPEWSPDSRWLSYGDIAHLGYFFWDPETGIVMSLKTTSKTDTTIGILNKTWAPDGSFYFLNFQRTHGDSLIWRLLIDSSLKVGEYIYQYVDDEPGTPIFPPGTMGYHIHGMYDNRNVIGFEIVSGFNYVGRRSISIPVLDTSWIRSRTDSWGNDEFQNNIIAGPDGVLYVYLSRRSKQERQHYSLPQDSVDSTARNACGWYRIDTAGHGLVQLVRSWSYNMGISLTADGEKIYYGFYLPNNTCAIFEMDKWGKHKSQITVPGEGSMVSVPQSVGTAAGLHVAVIIENATSARVTWHMEKAGSATVIIYNSLGQPIHTPIILESLDRGEHDQRINLSDVTTGVYFIVIHNNQVSGTARMVVAR
ncbi:MAG: T9SS type A sorting domain-containing protein [Bacteroidota bacterium]